jgi:hypothetical protein
LVRGEYDEVCIAICCWEIERERKREEKEKEETENGLDTRQIEG